MAVPNLVGVSNSSVDYDSLFCLIILMFCWKANVFADVLINKIYIIKYLLHGLLDKTNIKTQRICLHRTISKYMFNGLTIIRTPHINLCQRTYIDLD